MLRRLLTTMAESAFQPLAEPSLPETAPFGWLSAVAPRFPLRASQISILAEPEAFYGRLRAGCRDARRRIVLASLYLGSGAREAQLVQTILANERLGAGGLRVSVLLDFMRGSRLADNSRTMLQPLLQANAANCDVSLYHTPALRGLLKRIAPDRWNELVGLQHMKLYIFDDTLVISGANLSNDYFTNRQDRYFVINDARICDFYCGLVEKVKMFSLRMDGANEVRLDDAWEIAPYEGNKQDFTAKAGELIEDYLCEARNERNSHHEEGYDTWLYPLVQMGQLGVEQDADATDRILSEAPPGSTLRIATGYFNLTSQYINTLIKHSRANCDILMAHPKANGFQGAKFPAGGIPDAYSLIADKFRNEAEKWAQADRIGMFEYYRENWTYHGKGLWYYPKGATTPCLTLIGSPNFGERSVNRDLETQLALVTENVELRGRLDEECKRLYEYGLKAETGRSVPRWVHGFVYFFRNYF